MGILFAAACMNQTSRNQGLGQGAGLFVMVGFAAGSGSFAAYSAMSSTMLSFTDPEEVPPNCSKI